MLKLEGDAAFAYHPGDSMDGSVLQDCVEGTYIAFRNRLRDIQQASTCECNACLRIPDLDLKIVVHHGTIGRQRLMGLEELVGADVILVHRLLKNEVKERTGFAAYGLYTAAALEAASIDPIEQGLVEHREQTDVAGEVIGWVRDLQATWQRLLDRPRREIPEPMRGPTHVFEFDAPPQIVFEHLTSPVRRPLWDASIDSITEASPGGRRGADTVNHCMHGKDAIVEEILDWRPGEYWLSRTTLPGGEGAPQFLKSEQYTRTPDGGTSVELVLGSVEGRTPADDEPIFAAVDGNVQGAVAAIRGSIEATMAEIAVRPSVQPELPERPGRFLSEPIAY